MNEPLSIACRLGVQVQIPQKFANLKFLAVVCYQHYGCKNSSQGSEKFYSLILDCNWQIIWRTLMSCYKAGWWTKAYVLHFKVKLSLELGTCCWKLLLVIKALLLTIILILQKI